MDLKLRQLCVPKSRLDSTWTEQDVGVESPWMAPRGVTPLARSHELMTLVTSLMTFFWSFHFLLAKRRRSVVARTSNSEGLKSITTGENLLPPGGLLFGKPHVRRTWFLS